DELRSSSVLSELEGINVRLTLRSAILEPLYEGGDKLITIVTIRSPADGHRNAGAAAFLAEIQSKASWLLLTEVAEVQSNRPNPEVVATAVEIVATVAANEHVRPGATEQLVRRRLGTDQLEVCVRLVA